MQLFKRLIIASALAVLGLPLAAPLAVRAVDAPVSAAQADRLANIKSRGDAEIARRLTALGTLNSKIATSLRLSVNDKATLAAEVLAEINGLNALRAKLDAETTVAAAVADAHSIVTEYRVYALIVPKIQLVRMADDQQAVETKLLGLISKLQNRLGAAKSAGKNVADLQAQTDGAKAATESAQSALASVEAKLIGLQPTDYNNDHKILTGYRSSLKTAHQDTQTTVASVRKIIASLKTL